MKEKLRIAQLVLEAHSMLALMKLVLPEENQVDIDKYVGRGYKWREAGRGTHDQDFIDNLTAALGIKNKSTRYLMDCSPKEFFFAMPEIRRNCVGTEDLAKIFTSEDLVSILRGRESFLQPVFLDSNSTTERLHDQLEHSLRTGKTDQKFLYLDVESVRQWRELIHSRNYKTYEHCSGALKDLLRSKFWEESVKSGKFDCVIDLGVGAGNKDLEIIDSFARIAPTGNVQFVIVDTSWPMLEATIEQLRPKLARHNNRFTVKPCKADFLDLFAYRRDIRQEGNAAFFILGNTFANVSESALMKSIRGATNPGDLLVIGVEFLDPNDRETGMDEIISQYDNEYLRELAITPIRLRRPYEDFDAIRGTVRFEKSKPQEYSDLKESIAIVISIRWKGEDLIVAHSNRYDEAEFINFVQRFALVHKVTFSSPYNPNYKQVVFERTSNLNAAIPVGTKGVGK